MTLLREDLLEGRALAAAGPLRAAFRSSLEDLGARVETLDHDLDEDGARAWAQQASPLHGLLYDAVPPFGAGGREGLLAVTERGWPSIRAVAAGVLIPAGGGGKIVLLAPPIDAGPHAGAARAALENLARTLSIEWARHAITTAMIAPGMRTTEAEIATLMDFLVSPGGDYFSGCSFELGPLA